MVSKGKTIMLLGCPIVQYVHTFVHLSRKILLEQCLVNVLNSFDKPGREYSQAPTDNLIKFWRSKIKVTPWFKCVVVKASTSRLGHQSPFLGRLFWVDLIKSISNVRLYICLSVHIKFFRFQWNLVRRERSMSDARCMTVCSMTRSMVKVTSPWKLEILLFSKAISTIYNGSRQLTTDP